MKLTDKAVRALMPKERQFKASDGGGLYLLVMPNGARYWRLDYQLEGKRGTAALGVYTEAGGARGPMSLAAARLERDRCRELLRQGIRPADAKALEAARIREAAAAVREKARAERAARKAAAEAKRAQRQAEHWTVERVGEAWADIHVRGRAARTVQQLRQSLVDHVYPVIGSKSISSVTSADVVDVIDRLAVAGKHELRAKCVGGSPGSGTTRCCRATRRPTSLLRHTARPRSGSPRRRRSTHREICRTSGPKRRWSDAPSGATRARR
jgi:hypothetical protein